MHSRVSLLNATCHARFCLPLVLSLVFAGSSSHAQSELSAASALSAR